jgi:site-specific recombinase XerD
MRITLRYAGNPETCRIFDESNQPIEEANKFLRAIELRGLSRHTVRAYGYDLVIMYRWLKMAGKELRQLTETDLIEFIAVHRTQKAEPKTINRRIIALRLLYRFCHDCELPSSAGASRPAAHYVGRHYDPELGIIRVRKRGQLKIRVKIPRKLIEPLSPEQVNAFLRLTCRYRDLVLVLLMLFCGLRSAEVLSLRIPDINWVERKFRVQGKGDKERMLPLPEVLVTLIEKYLRLERPTQCSSDHLLVIQQGKKRGQAMTTAGLRSLFRHRRLQKGIEVANPHRMRHTFGASMARSGVKIPVLQRLMGHADALMTLQYIQLSMVDVSEEYQRAIEKIQARYDPHLQD